MNTRAKIVAVEQVRDDLLDMVHELYLFSQICCTFGLREHIYQLISRITKNTVILSAAIEDSGNDLDPGRGRFDEILKRC